MILYIWMFGYYAFLVNFVGSYSTSFIFCAVLMFISVCFYYLSSTFWPEKEVCTFSFICISCFMVSRCWYSDNIIIYHQTWSWRLSFCPDALSAYFTLFNFVFFSLFSTVSNKMKIKRKKDKSERNTQAYTGKTEK